MSPILPESQPAPILDADLLQCINEERKLIEI